MDNMKEKTIGGLFWHFSERFLAQMISLVVSIVLARRLSPTEYGIIAFVTIFINIANVLAVNGLGASLVQKKNSDELDFSSMFYAGLVISLLVYAALFFSAPAISATYKRYDGLTAVLRIMGLRIPLAAFNSIQQAYVQKKMVFKKFFFSTLFGTVVSAVVGIVMAYRGFGVWALVGQYLTNCTIDTVVLFFTIDWKPKRIFSFVRFKALFSFGWRVTCTGLIGNVFEQLKGLLIGAKYEASDLAYYNKGDEIPALVTNNINSAVNSVLFPVLTKYQDDWVSVKSALQRMMKLTSFVLMPVLLGIAAVSDTLVSALLTEKWLPCVPFLRVLCVQYCFNVLSTVNLQALKAIGRSDITLKLEFIKKPILLAFILLAINISPFAIAVGALIYNVLAMVINAVPNGRVIRYGVWEQIRDTGGAFLLAATMAVVVWLVGRCRIDLYWLLALQILVGAVYYVGVALLFRSESLRYLFQTAKELLHGRRGAK
ncbi:MAG: lipopolysaccharide biosynthesis protein [Oscillospiraceae bacterium]|nr:lipopolysaccharide biosynthesis protein [Oscillospiraceae bacterium]